MIERDRVSISTDMSDRSKYPGFPNIMYQTLESFLVTINHKNVEEAHVEAIAKKTRKKGGIQETIVHFPEAFDHLVKVLRVSLYCKGYE
jgi:hypothetical protein